MRGCIGPSSGLEEGVSIIVCYNALNAQVYFFLPLRQQYHLLLHQ